MQYFNFLFVLLEHVILLKLYDNRIAGELWFGFFLSNPFRERFRCGGRGIGSRAQRVSSILGEAGNGPSVNFPQEII